MNVRVLRLKKKLKYLFLCLGKHEGSPAKRARGIAVGVFCGCFPFFGFQSLMGVCLAGIVRGNYLLAVLGTWISNPITYLPLYWLNYKVGTIFLGQGTDFNNFSELTQGEIWNEGLHLSSRILLGSLIVGLMLGLIMGCILYVLLKLRSKRNSKI